MIHKVNWERHDIPDEIETGAPDAADPTLTRAGPVGLSESVTALANVYLSARSRLIASQGFTANEFVLLACFIERDEWTATQLTEVIAADASRISRLVNGLVERGLLRRRRRVDDRRVVRLLLTESGGTVVRELFETVQQYDARLLAGVSDDELAGLAAVTAKVVANHAALQDGASG